MEKGENSAAGEPEGGKGIFDVVYPAISRKALKVRAAIKARSRSEIAAPPTLVTMELEGGAAANGDGGEGAGAGRGILERFFKGVRLPSRADWLRAVDEVPAGSTLRLAGGEPLMSPHLEAVLFQADCRCLETEIVTNGARLVEHAPVIYGLGVARVRLVFCGSEEAASSPDAFENAVRGALALKGLRYGTTRPVLVVHLVTQAGAGGWIAGMVERALAMGGDQVVIHYPRAQGDSPGEGPAREGAKGGSAGAANRALMQELDEVRKQRRRGAVRFFPPLGRVQAERYCLGHPVSPGPRKCLVPWRSMTIGADGRARLCGRQAVGDIRESFLADIYNGEAARAFRRKIKLETLPECAGCARRFGDEGFAG